jgi:hypothetical protein
MLHAPAGVTMQVYKPINTYGLEIYKTVLVVVLTVILIMSSYAVHI